MSSDYLSYKSALSGIRLPAAFVNWNLLQKNADLVHERARHLPVRLATKSLRSTWVIKRILSEQPYVKGLLAYSALEAAYLCEQGLDDILIAYPTMEPHDINALIPHLRAKRRICFMTDLKEHIKLLGAIGRVNNMVIPIAVDVDLSVEFPFLYFGVYRSRVRCERDLVELAAVIKQEKYVNLIGLMGYEAQMSLGDHYLRKPLTSAAIRMLKRYSSSIIVRRRRDAVNFLTREGFKLAFVNGGGTATLESTVRDSSVTELTAGSAFFGPHSFDHFTNFSLHPAAGFALPVIRFPKPGYVTCHGGGYIASGPQDGQKLPLPFLPAHLELLRHEGAGEVQTPLKNRCHHKFVVGDPVLFRHAKSGEIAEHFNHFYIIYDDKVLTTANTYRGDGHAFL